MGACVYCYSSSTQDSGQCENNDVCIGCRANAHYYLGDIRASDPKCWLNPTSRQGLYLETKE